MVSPNKPIIGITMGDPVGVGPEVLSRPWQRGRLPRCARPVVFGDIAILERALLVTGISLPLYEMVEFQRSAVKDW